VCNARCGCLQGDGNVSHMADKSEQKEGWETGFIMFIYMFIY